VRQERVAGNMADGVSRSTNGRQIGTWAVQALAGTENSFPGVVRVIPPLVTTAEEVDEALEILGESVAAAVASA
jgi:4-aminobutyrate aminotransferase-like enzyme